MPAHPVAVHLAAVAHQSSFLHLLGRGKREKVKLLHVLVLESIVLWDAVLLGGEAQGVQGGSRQV